VQFKLAFVCIACQSVEVFEVNLLTRCKISLLLADVFNAFDGYTLISWSSSLKY